MKKITAPIFVGLFVISLYAAYRFGYANGKAEVNPYLFEWAIATHNLPDDPIVPKTVCAVIEGRLPKRHSKVVHFK